MKKIILLIALAIAPALSFGQSMFDKLEDRDGVDAVIINKEAFEILSKFNAKSLQDNEAMQVFEMIKDLNELKVFSTNKASIAEEMNAMVSKAVKSSKLVELMRLKEDGSRVKIYVKSTSKKDVVSEVLMYVKGINKKTNGISDAAVISLTGNIDINKLSNIADTFTKDSKIKVTTNRK